MKKYIFFVTGSEHYVDVSKKLFENKIARPILWIGHDRHEKRIKPLFGDIVLSDLIFRHRTNEIKDIAYSGEHQDFFNSINYLKAKDRCLKMMDRLDLYGMFNRLDRETHLHYVVIWALKHIHRTNPDILICTEAPHDWPKYIIYQICLYLKIPCYKIFNWNLAPICFLENMKTGEIIKNEGLIEGPMEKLFSKIYNNYVNDLLSKKKDYDIFYMKLQREKLKFLNILFSSLNTLIIPILKDIKHNVGMKLKKKYNPINPYKLGIISRLKIKSMKRKNLKKILESTYDKFDINKKYVYFPLHFEPERTTNPDGGDFHDQFVVLTELRKLIPDDINIIVKEHPSQIIFANSETLPGEVGSRGRSPLFYDLIKNISGIKLIDMNFNSIELILKSQFVATITGSVALESSILGKPSLTFGSTWYSGCPNIFSWDKEIKFENIVNTEIHGKEKILDFLKEKRKKYSFANGINSSQRNFHSDIIDSKFDEIQNKSVFRSLKTLFESI